MFWTRCVTDETAIWCHFQPHHAKLADIQLWKNNILFGYLEEQSRDLAGMQCRKKNVRKRKSGWYSPQQCWWQSVRVGRGSENGLKCLAHFHAVLTSMTALTASSLSPSLSFALFRLSLLYLLFYDTLWDDGWMKIYRLLSEDEIRCTWIHHLGYNSIISHTSCTHVGLVGWL